MNLCNTCLNDSCKCVQCKGMGICGNKNTCGWIYARTKCICYVSPNHKREAYNIQGKHGFIAWNKFERLRRK